MKNIVNLKTGDVLLLPIYYYSQPYKSLSSVVDFGADFIIENMQKQIQKLAGEKVANLIFGLIPKDIDSDKITSELVKKVTSLTNVRYIHAELYLENGWTLQAYTNGVKLTKYKPSAFQKFDVYRFKNVDEEGLISLVNKYWNLPFDYSSQVISAVQELIDLPMKKFFGFENLEEKTENFMRYDDPSKVSSGELCARMLKEAGAEIEGEIEYISPDDLSKMKNVIKVL